MMGKVEILRAIVASVAGIHVRRATVTGRYSITQALCHGADTVDKASNRRRQKAKQVNHICSRMVGQNTFSAKTHLVCVCVCVFIWVRVLIHKGQLYVSGRPPRRVHLMSDWPCQRRTPRSQLMVTARSKAKASATSYNKQ